MLFTTATGSQYELAEGRVRRLSSPHSPTPRQGKDGKWKDYFKCMPAVPCVGLPVLFIWNIRGQSTLTANVVEISEISKERQAQL